MKSAVIILSFFIFSMAQAGALKLTSSTIKAGGKIRMDQVYNSFGCSGKNQSPVLKWSGVPKGTKSFALTMYDPDAPTGSGWWHWVVFNIPADVKELALDASNGHMPQDAVQSRTDFGKPGYGGPCPPPGKPHHYVFTLFALKDKIDLTADSPAAMVGFYANQNKLQSAKLTATYKR
jgi:Raf kinase inhibitor-like YbhB/YbcL family protein